MEQFSEIAQALVSERTELVNDDQVRYQSLQTLRSSMIRPRQRIRHISSIGRVCVGTISQVVRIQ